MRISLLLFILSSLAILAFADFCPGHKIRCKVGQTCCDDKKGSYGCCPYAGATCCKDGSHCCPRGTTCDLMHQRCMPNDTNQGPVFLRKILGDQNETEESRRPFAAPGGLIQRPVNAKKTCQDGIQKCPISYTCCEQATGGYGCCPETDGICCADKVHCCPRHKTCNIVSGSCD